MKVKFDMSGLKKKFDAAVDIQRSIIKPAYEHFKDTTPIQTGNARRKTTLQGNKIVADYPYASKLDEGSSDQARDGMTKPTEEFIEKLVEKHIKGLGK